MTEYISREEVLDKSEYTENFNLVVPVRLIKAIPAADVQPVKSGKWNFQGNQLFKCTNCNDIFTQEQLESIRKSFPNYCPNCGADMRGESGG